MNTSIWEISVLNTNSFWDDNMPYININIK